MSCVHTQLQSMPPRPVAATKLEVEAFRVASHVHVHAALEWAYAAAQQPQPPPAEQPMPPDTGRVIIHLDMDAFYSQVEELRDPSLATRPLGITQKHIIVTCNRLARARGVTKLMGLEEARRRCPELVLVRCASDGDLH